MVISMDGQNKSTERSRKFYRKFKNVLIILLLGFLIGTGILCCDQLDSDSITSNHPWRILGAYLLGTLVIGCVFLMDKDKN